MDKCENWDMCDNPAMSKNSRFCDNCAKIHGKGFSEGQKSAEHQFAKSENDGEKLTKVYHCGDCGKVHDKKNIQCCGDYELEELYQCGKCKVLFVESWKHHCEKSENDGGKK